MTDLSASASRGQPLLHIAVLAVAAVLTIMLIVRCIELIGDRDTLAALHQQQEQAVQESLKLRQQLGNLASRTAQLASEGDAGAKTVVEAMRRQGITLNPPVPPASETPASPATPPK